MRLALFVKEGTTQFVLTADTDWEKKIVRDLSDRLVTYELGMPEKREIAAKIMKGGFYECQGGWVREGHSEDSLIVRFTDEIKANG